MAKSNVQSLMRMAQQADKHVLYEKSVQAPETEIELMIETFKEIRGWEPMSLREDFCGTALLITEWCKSHSQRTAQGVDLDQATLDWGREHNLDPAGEEVTSRIELLCENVLEVQQPKMDMACAFNFSFNGFKTREQLRAYFEAARQGLNENGMLVLDVYGGTESMDEVEEEREVDDEDFTYIWHQESFNPIDHALHCHIHFAFADGSRMNRAFSYDWRLWTLPELQELLLEAGFSSTHVYWEEFEDTDDDDDYLEGTGNYREVTKVDNQESWISYLFAVV